MKRKTKPRKPNINDYLAQYIQDTRHYYGLNQSELGDFIDVSHAAISDVENGKTNITFNLLITILAKLEASSKGRDNDL